MGLTLGEIHVGHESRAVVLCCIYWRCSLKSFVIQGKFVDVELPVMVWIAWPSSIWVIKSPEAIFKVIFAPKQLSIPTPRWSSAYLLRWRPHRHQIA